MLNLHCNGDVFNQRFVTSPRTELLHACLSPKQQNLTTLASGEKGFLFRIRLNDYNKRLNYIARVWISAIVPKFQPSFN